MGQQHGKSRPSDLEGNNNQYGSLHDGEEYKDELLVNSRANNNDNRWRGSNNYRSRNILSSYRTNNRGGDGARSNYNSSYLRMGLWSLLLIFGWLATRGWCKNAELPYDCIIDEDIVTTMNDLQMLLLYGFVQCFFLDITDSNRFFHLLDPHQWYFFVFYFAASIGYSWISSIPELRSSLHSDLTTLQLSVYIILFALIISVVIFHIYYAYKVYPMRNFITYVTARLAVVIFYTIFIVEIYKENEDILPGFPKAQVHFHHYFLAWAFSLFAQFNHPVSIIFMAITTAIFVQGVGAYHAEFMAYNDLNPFRPKPFKPFS